MEKNKKLLASMLTAFITLSSTVCGTNVNISAAESKTFDIGGKTATVGDYFQMGTYNNEPILWRCVDVDENGPLILSDKVLCLKAFDAAGDNTNGSHGLNNSLGEMRRSYGSDYWADSNIRDWLNSDANAGEVVWTCGNAPSKDNLEMRGLDEAFLSDEDKAMIDRYNNNIISYDNEAGFLNGFTESEKAAVRSVRQKFILNGYVNGNERSENYHINKYDISEVVQNYDTALGETADDKIFLLSVKQLHSVWKNLGDYFNAVPTKKVAEDHSFWIAENVNCHYWLRDANADIEAPFVRVVENNGKIQITSPYAYNLGVRPAFYLDTAAANITGGTGTETDAYVINGGEAQSTVVEYNAAGGKIYFDTATGTITGADSTITEVTVPRTINGVNVKAVAPNAFTSCTALEKVYCTKESPADNADLYPPKTTIIYNEHPLGFIFGDADADDNITASDAAYVLQKALVRTFELPIERETENWLRYADVDGDEDITSGDAAYVLQKALKSTFELPAEKNNK